MIDIKKDEKSDNYIITQTKKIEGMDFHNQLTLTEEEMAELSNYFVERRTAGLCIRGTTEERQGEGRPLEPYSFETAMEERLDDAQIYYGTTSAQNIETDNEGLIDDLSNMAELTKEEIIEAGCPLEPACFETDREETWYNVGLYHGATASENPQP